MVRREAVETNCFCLLIFIYKTEENPQDLNLTNGETRVLFIARIAISTFFLTFFLFLKFLYSFFLINLFIYIFLAVLGLCFCVRAFSSCGKWGLFFIAVHRLLIAVASLVGEHGI